MKIKMIQFKTYKQYSFITNINNNKFRVHVRYNSYLDNYYIDVDKFINGVYINIINSVMLYTGVNLFLQHPQLDLGYLYIVPLKVDLYSENPTSSTIQNFMIFWVSDN